MVYDSKDGRQIVDGEHFDIGFQVYNFASGVISRLHSRDIYHTLQLRIFLLQQA